MPRRTAGHQTDPIFERDTIAGNRDRPDGVLMAGEGVQYCAGGQVPHDRRPVVADGDRPGAVAGDGRRDRRVGGARKRVWDFG